MKLINITLEVDEHHITGLESHLREHFKVISYKIIPDTKALYENDGTFKKLVKAVKSATELKDKYINEHDI